MGYEYEIEQQGYGYKSWIGYCNYNNITKYDSEFENVDKFAFIFIAKYIKNEEGEHIKKNLLFLYREKDDTAWTVGFAGNKLRSHLIQSAIIPAFRDPKDQLRAYNYTWFGKLLKHHFNSVNDEYKTKLYKAFNNVEEISNEIYKDVNKKIIDSGVKVAFPNTELSIQYIPNSKDHNIYKNAMIYIDDGFRSELKEKGAGIQSAVIIGLFNYYIQNIAHNSSSLLAIEEPELYLHPQGRMVISCKLDEFVECGENKNNHQVVIATHSIEFISNLDINTNLILVKKDNGGTTVKNMEFNTPKDRQILIKKQNAEMFFADAVILVEGADKYILEEMAKEFGKNHIIKVDDEIKELGKNWLNEYNVSIISCGGKHEFIKYANILNKVDIPYYIMADFDYLKEGVGKCIRELRHDKLENELNRLKQEISKNTPRYKKIDDITEGCINIETRKYLHKLKCENIFILTGELEDFYIKTPKFKKEAGVIETIGKSMEENKPITEYVDHEEFYELFKLFIKKCLNIELMEYREFRA